MDALRQRIAPAVGGTLGYTPVHLSDSEDLDDDDSEFTSGDELREPRRRRSRRGDRSEVGGARRGRDGELWPHYTPLYTNMKVLRRKRLDASMVYYRAGPCTKLCFLISLWGVSFLGWLGVTLAGGSPYIIPKYSAEARLALSRSIFGAALMYFVCGCIAGYSWYKSSYGTRPLPTMGDTSLQ